MLYIYIYIIHEDEIIKSSLCKTIQKEIVGLCTKPKPLITEADLVNPFIFAYRFDMPRIYDRYCICSRSAWMEEILSARGQNRKNKGGNRDSICWRKYESNCTIEL